MFVDASGRRQRRVRRLGRFLVIPAAGYVALLLSAVLGGPSVPSPYLPLPEPGRHPAGDHRPEPSRTPPGTAAAPAGASPSAGPVPPTASTTTAPAPGPTATPKATGTPTARGKSTAHPVPTHTRRGRG